MGRDLLGLFAISMSWLALYCWNGAHGNWELFCYCNERFSTKLIAFKYLPICFEYNQLWHRQNLFCSFFYPLRFVRVGGNIFHSLSHPRTKMVFETFRPKCKGMFILHSQQQGCWWLVDGLKKWLNIPVSAPAGLRLEGIALFKMIVYKS